MASEFEKFLKLLSSATGLMVKKKGLGENLDVAKVRDGIFKLKERCDALSDHVSMVDQLKKELEAEKGRSQALAEELQKVRSEAPKKDNRRVWHYLSQNCKMPNVGEQVLVLYADMKDFADGMERGDKNIDFTTKTVNSVYLGDYDWDNVPPMSIVVAWQNFSSIPPLDKIEQYVLTQFEEALNNLQDVKSFLRDNEMAFTRKNNKAIYARVERLKKNLPRYKKMLDAKYLTGNLAADLLKPTSEQTKKER